MHYDLNFSVCIIMCIIILYYRFSAELIRIRKPAVADNSFIPFHQPRVATGIPRS